MLEPLLGIYFIILFVSGLFGPIMLMDVAHDYTIAEICAFVVFWPITIAIVVILGVSTFFGRFERSKKMSRKQSREIEFLKQKALIAQGALEAQQEFERLITKEIV